MTLKLRVFPIETRTESLYVMLQKFLPWFHYTSKVVLIFFGGTHRTDRQIRHNSALYKNIFIALFYNYFIYTLC